MSKIIVDQFQTTGGVAFGLPTADGVADQLVATNGSGNLSWVDATKPVPEDTYRIVGTVLSGSSRQNVYGSGEWSTSGPFTTYYNSWQDDSSRIQGVNMFMGDGEPSGGSTTQSFFVNDGMHNETRKLEFAHYSRVGHHNKDYLEYDNSTGDYSGIHIRAMPIRNTTDSDITRDLGTYASARDANYGGAVVMGYTPNAVAYSGVTGGTWTKFSPGNSSSSQTNFGTSSITVPAGKTVVVFQTDCTFYQTTYRFKSTNFFHKLHTFFPPSEDLVCDLRMLAALQQARIPGATDNGDNFWKVYAAAAEIYGDR